MEWILALAIAGVLALLVDGRGLLGVFEPLPPRRDYKREAEERLHPMCYCGHKMKNHSLYPGCSQCDCKNGGGYEWRMKRLEELLQSQNDRSVKNG